MTDADLEALVSKVKSLEDSLTMAWQLLYRVERKLLTSGMLLTIDDLSPDRDSQPQVVTGVSNLLQELSHDFKCQLEELDALQGHCCPMMPGPGPNG
jgi:hypothetical protein